MAIYTQLTPIAIPGRVYSFVAKDPAADGKGLGPFTALSVLALPGSIHSFAAKAPADAGEKGLGLFTELSVLCVPGGRHIFVAKAPAEPVIAPPVVVVAADEGGAWWPTEPTWERKEKLRERILRDDNDILEIVMSIVLSGRL